MPSPELDEAKKQIEAARQKFQERVARILLHASNEADSFAQAIGEISAAQAYDAWVENLFNTIGEKGHLG